MCKGEDVIIVGGGNSAGQAARAAHRRQSGNRGQDELPGRGSRRWKAPGKGPVPQQDHRRRDHRRRPASLRDDGAVPATKWLDNCVALDDHGFIKTGPDLTPEDLNAGRWPLERPPHLLETSVPGVFAIGDVRGGNIKRVVSAVGEGSIAMHSCVRCSGSSGGAERDRTVDLLSAISAFVSRHTRIPPDSIFYQRPDLSGFRLASVN